MLLESKLTYWELKRELYKNPLVLETICNDVKSFCSILVSYKHIYVKLANGAVYSELAAYDDGFVFEHNHPVFGSFKLFSPLVKKIARQPLSAIAQPWQQ